jgi:nitrate reductase beta subunit
MPNSAPPELYRLLGIARYEDRYVIPQADAPQRLRQVVDVQNPAASAKAPASRIVGECAGSHLMSLA